MATKKKGKERRSKKRKNSSSTSKTLRDEQASLSFCTASNEKMASCAPWPAGRGAFCTVDALLAESVLAPRGRLEIIIVEFRVSRSV